MKKLSLFFISFALLLTACGELPSAPADKDHSTSAAVTTNTPENSGVNTSSSELTSAELPSVEVSQKPVLSLEQLITLSCNAVNAPVEEPDVVIEAQTDNKVLMSGGSYLFTYNRDTEQINLITDSALSYKTPVRDMLYFCNWDHDEFKVDWRNDDSVTATGNKVIAYHGPYDLVLMEDLEKDFLATQRSWRHAENVIYFDYQVDEFFGNIYQTDPYKPIGNLHLPHAYVYNANIMSYDVNACFVIDNDVLKLYYLGDVLLEIRLSSGTWELLRGNYTFDPEFTEANILNHEFTAEELKAAITEVNAFIIDVDTQKMYHIDQYGNLKLLLTDIVDYSPQGSDLYWMNTHGEVYVYDYGTDTNTLIGEKAIGIAKFGNIGFLVHPDNGKDYSMIAGYPVAINWLHEQEQ